MDEMTRKMIEEMASTLGTTVEHLWSVLVTQAPISSLVSLLHGAIVIVALVVSLKVLKTGLTAYGNYKTSKEEDCAIGLIVCGGAGTVLSIIFLLLTFHHLNMIIAGFFNPEYYALTTLLDLIR